MDDAKVAFLFGEVPAGFDADDPDDRAESVALSPASPLSGGRSEIRAIVAEQIATERPPFVWAAAQRLLALGIDRTEVMNQLALALSYAAKETLEGQSGGFDEGYERVVALLPVPAAEQVEAAALELAGTAEAVTITDLERLVYARLGRAEPDPLSQLIVDRIMDQLVLDDDGPIALLSGDRVFAVAHLTDGIVLTHRLNASERELDVLTIAFDLAGHGRRDDLRLADGSELVVFSAEPGHLAWDGPPGWLDSYAPGTLLAVRVNGEGVASLEVLDEEPEVDPGLVDLVRSAYDDEVDESWLPVEGETLVLAVLARDRDAFAHPRPPLEVLCQAAGLERRRHEVAHEESVWKSQADLRRMHRVFDALDGQEQRKAAARILELADADAKADPADLRGALADLADREVAEVVLEELAGTGRATSFGEALIAAAATPRQIGMAQWVAAVAAEQEGQVLVADAHLQLALEADPSSAAIVERCAWYASDRGDAGAAVRLWRRLRPLPTGDIAIVEPFTRRAGPKLGRNDPCWCGSGRKSKTCHRTASPNHESPLADRVVWLCRKAAAYLEHAGPDGRELVLTLAHCRAVDLDDDGVLDALSDPIVVDAALTEGGWFTLFLEERGPLLPADEALLAHSWTLVARTVYEVVEAEPGSGVRVRDLRSGDVLDVRERTFSSAARPQSLVCGRAVPDGESHQFVGALFPVAPGTEKDVLELCEEGDPEALCEYVGSLHRPPAFQTREGEPLVACTAVFDVPDREEAERVLDGCYLRDEEGWVEMHRIGPDEEIVRATLSLDGSRLEVATHSEARLERVLNRLADVLPGARLVDQDRAPLRPGEVPTVRGHDQPVIDADAIVQIQDILEQRWLQESVPALGGLTPRQAAEDPTRREEVLRLIASFPTEDDLPSPAVTMRPARLRALLGL